GRSAKSKVLPMLLFGVMALVAAILVAVSMAAPDRDKRLRRLAGMLARKGYGEGMALRVVRQALEEEGEDTEGLDEPF
ncbi:hypothetical protein ACWDMY_25275, partial [Streptomyces globisporus]